MIVVMCTISLQTPDFEEVKRQAHEQLRTLSQMYTKPPNSDGEAPIHKYSLRGISTNPHTVYVLEKTAPEDWNDILSAEAKDWQWWRIAYLRDNTEPVEYAKVTEETALKAAMTESNNILLVYANERAVSYQLDDLPPQLHNFVRADNLEFSSELDESTHSKPTSPIRRRAIEDDSDDLEMDFQRSPPHDRELIDTRPLNNEDDRPPEYSSLSGTPSDAQNPAAGGSYDDTIPTALQAKSLSSGADSMIVDRMETDNGQEMQERSTGQSILT